MEVLVLGPTEVHADGDAVDLGTPKQRALLAALALFRGRPVSVDTVADLLWGDRPPPSAAATIQAYVSGLRRVLEPRRERRTPATVLVTQAPGYALRVPADAVDAARFVDVVARHHRMLAGVPLTGSGELDEQTLHTAARELDQATGSWRGEPFAELGGAHDAAAERARLEELLLVAREDRAVVDLALGRHATLAAELEALTAAHPLRERLWGLRAVALARAGRQADALDVLARLRKVLDDELALEPGVELRDLQTAVLRQEPALQWHPPRSSVSLTQSPPTPAQAPPSGPAGTRTVPVAPWPLVGREEELEQLVSVLDRALAGVPGCALLVGEAGIGKSRLAAETAALARQRGFQVAVGRSSQDDAAPPLWPWTAVLEALGRPGAEPADPDDPGAGFRVREQISRAVRAATVEAPVLVVLEDLHWADVASVRVLGLLLETLADERLVVLATRRAHPEPTGPLADLHEAMARHGATRIELAGLGCADVGRLVGSLMRSRPRPDQAASLRERTEGNPFFVVEYARLVGVHGDLDDVLTDAQPPTAVHDVLARRLAALPDETTAALRTAAVIGRQFDVSTLAASLAGARRGDTSAGSGDGEVEALLDVLEPAQVAGLVREVGVDTFLFGHALVRDTLYALTSPSRRARLHARVAACLEPVAGHETEVARHWLAAGAAYASKAWPAAVVAADLARRVHAHERAAELLTAALEAMGADPAATRADRYDVLLRLVDAHRWTAMWPELTACVEQAVAIADQLGDVEMLGRAAISTTQGALWQSARYGEVHEGVVTALQRSLARLPVEDAPLRCRVLLGLAIETYYATAHEERQQLVDEALAMATRLGDDHLLLEAHQTAFVALWSSRTANDRLAHATQALEMARRLGDEQAVVVSGSLLCVVLSELGRPAEMFAQVRQTRAEAERLRLPYGLIVLDVLVVPWLAMAGRVDECERLLDRIQRLDAQMSLEHSGDASGAAAMSVHLWTGDVGRVADLLLAIADQLPFPMAPLVCSHLWRAGRHDEARRYREEHPFDLGHDTWFSMAAWGSAAEVALYLDDPILGREAHDLLAPYAGHSSGPGSSSAAGPVDAYLALAARAAGDLDSARRHADRALALAEAWHIPVMANWFRGVRDSYGF